MEKTSLCKGMVSALNTQRYNQSRFGVLKTDFYTHIEVDCKHLFAFMVLCIGLFVLQKFKLSSSALGFSKQGIRVSANFWILWIV